MIVTKTLKCYKILKIIIYKFIHSFEKLLNF